MVVALTVEEVLTLDEALPATVVALEVADEVLTEVVSDALRVLEATVPDEEEELGLPAVDVPSAPDVDDPDAPAVVDPDDPDVDDPGEPVDAVFQ